MGSETGKRVCNRRVTASSVGSAADIQLAATAAASKLASSGLTDSYRDQVRAASLKRVLRQKRF